MNTSVKLSLILIITIEISFTTNPAQDLLILAGSGFYLISKRTRLKTWAYLFLLPLIPAASLLVSQLRYGSARDAVTWGLFIRTYTYVWLGADFTLTTSVSNLVSALEVTFHVPTKLVYGLAGALGTVTRFRDQIKIIRAASAMRGFRLRLWSPQLYFKALITALTWSNQLASAMTSHGFVAGAPRSHLTHERLTITDVWAPLILAAVQIPLLF